MSRETKEERLKSITDKLEEGIQELFTSDHYREYLRFLGKFHSYSFNNVLLILMQKPEASLIAGYKTWQTMGRQVMKGEEGITILAPCPYKKMKQVDILDTVTQEPVRNEAGEPMKEWKEVTYTSFRTATVFDVSQTEGKELPTLVNELQGTVDDFSDLMELIQAVSSAPIRFNNWADDKKGYYSPARHEIVIKSGMSELQTVKTAIHEVAHSILHGSQSQPKDSATKEVEAESIAYVVCQSLGLDTSDYTFGYLARWSSSKSLPELQSSLGLIQKTSHQLIERIEREREKTRKRDEEIRLGLQTKEQEVTTSLQRAHRRR